MNFDESESCPHCFKEFSTRQTRNRHIRKFHSDTSDDSKGNKDVEKSKRIICCICQEDHKTFDNLEIHMMEKHGILSQKKEVCFNTEDQFQEWFAAEKIEVNYCVIRTNKASVYYEKVYVCNRSDVKGYVPKYNKRTQKAGGSIKMKGVCLSRYKIKRYLEGKYKVVFNTTHTGHEEEIRAQHLSKNEEKSIVNKLNMGVSVDRIMEDASSSSMLNISGRCEMLKRKDVDNLRRKYNIENRRDTTAKERLAILVNGLSEEDAKISLKLIEESLARKRNGRQENKKRKMETQKYFPSKK